VGLEAGMGRLGKGRLETGGLDCLGSGRAHLGGLRTIVMMLGRMQGMAGIPWRIGTSDVSDVRGHVYSSCADDIFQNPTHLSTLQHKDERTTSLVYFDR